MTPSRDRSGKVERRLPRPRELAEFVRFRPLDLDRPRRRLSRALTIHDLRTLARRSTPKGAFEYTDGGAEAEVSLHRAREAYREIEFHPDALQPNERVVTATRVLGAESALPFGIAPTGFTRLMHSAGEIAGAGAAGAVGIPFTLSTLGTASIEDVARANPDGRNWFQLYMMRDRDVSYGLVERAAAAGFDTLFLTVDTPIAGARFKDTRNGFSFPPQLGLSTLLDAAPRVRWWFDLLTTPKLELASLSDGGGTIAELVAGAMDPMVSIEDLVAIRRMWSGPLVVKGIQTLEDAVRVVEAGADGVVLSNHGGRQLDRSPLPFHLLPEVSRELGGDATVMIDSGIMNGADIVAAVALGARFALVGRAYLYGLMAGGREGVDRAIAILRSEIERTLFLLGVPSLGELAPRHVTQLRRLVPYVR